MGFFIFIVLFTSIFIGVISKDIRLFIYAIIFWCTLYYFCLYPTKVNFKFSEGLKALLENIFIWYLFITLIIGVGTEIFLISKVIFKH